MHMHLKRQAGFDILKAMPACLLNQEQFFVTGLLLNRGSG